MTPKIPVIDLHKLTSGNNATLRDWEQVADAIRVALHEVGFMYLANHGIPSKVITNNFEISRSFFELPLDSKRKYKKELEKSRNGWVEPGQELLHENSTFEYRECFDILTKERIFPSEVPCFGATHNELEAHSRRLIEVVLKLLALSLKLEDAEYFLKTCRHLGRPDVENECEFSMIYYPPIFSDTELHPETVRCAEHTDYEIMTFLFQNQVGGLEIKTADGEWISADPIPDTILVNTGDLLEMWTNKYYKATLHRVTIPKTEEEREKARYSFAYFIAPDSETLIVPLVSPVIGDTETTPDGNPLKESRKGALIKQNSKSYEKDANVPISAYDHIMKRVYTAYGVNK